MTTQNVLTVTLRNGVKVLARMHNGTLRSLIYTNTTAATKSAAALRARGINAEVYRGPIVLSRCVYVQIIESV